MVSNRFFFVLLIVLCGNLYFVTSALSITQEPPITTISRKVTLSGTIDSGVTIAPGGRIEIPEGETLRIMGPVTIKGIGFRLNTNSKLVVEGDVLIEDGSIYTALGSESAQTHIEINGKLILDAPGTSDCVEGVIIVKEDVIIRGGKIRTSGKSIFQSNLLGYRKGYSSIEVNGELEIGGNVEGEDKENEADSFFPFDINGNYEGDEAKVVIKGDAKLAYGTSYEPTYEFKGNVTFFPDSYFDFAKVVLSGNKKQCVKSSNSDSGSVELPNLIVKNSSVEGVVFDAEGVHLVGMSQETEAPIFFHKFNGYRFNQLSDLKLTGDITCNEFRPNGFSLYLDGSLTQSCEYDSGISVNNGALAEINGNLFAHSIGVGPNSKLLVHGDLKVEKSIFAYETIEVKGSLLASQCSIRGTDNSRILVGKDIRGGDCKYYGYSQQANFVLSGDVPQEISLDPNSDNLKIINNNTSAEGVVFNSENLILNSFIHNCRPYIQKKNFILSDKADSDDDSHKDNLDAYPEDPTRWEPEGICLAVTRDFDKDGMDDGDELKYFGNASQAPTDDYDQDGLSNAWELEHDFDPIDPSDATFDFDGDGFTNLQEFLAGTDPKDPASVPTSSAAFNPAVINLLLLN